MASLLPNYAGIVITSGGSAVARFYSPTPSVQPLFGRPRASPPVTTSGSTSASVSRSMNLAD